MKNRRLAQVPAYSDPPPDPTPPPTFDPLTVAGARVWYDAARNTNAGGVITALPDRSGNACDAIVPAGNEPFFTASNPAFNGIPTFDCSPAGDMRFVDTNDLNIATNAPFTVVMVADGAGDYFCGAHTTLGSIYWAGSRAMSGDAGTHNLDDGATTAAAPSVLIAVYDGASSRWYINAKTPIASGDAGAQSLGAAPNRAMRFGMYGGGSLPVWSQDGSTAHALVYDGALSQADCEYLLTGFGALAGIAIGP